MNTAHMTHVSYDTLSHQIRITFFGFVISRYYRKAWEDALELAQEYQCDRWLVDFRSFRGAHNSDLEWSFGNWLDAKGGEIIDQNAGASPRASFLLPNDRIVEYLVSTSLERTSKERNLTRISCFKNTPEAKAYLEIEECSISS
ncbi:MAG: hypothetical protein AAFU64_07830 [Bacteroidota bacterium]